MLTGAVLEGRLVRKAAQLLSSPSVRAHEVSLFCRLGACRRTRPFGVSTASEVVVRHRQCMCLYIQYRLAVSNEERDVLCLHQTSRPVKRLFSFLMSTRRHTVYDYCLIIKSPVSNVLLARFVISVAKVQDFPQLSITPSCKKAFRDSYVIPNDR